MPKTLPIMFAQPQGQLNSDFTATQRRDLRRQLQAGELEDLLFSAVVFEATPNRNHARFRPQDLDDFAASFTGKPFLRNHDVDDIGSRDGTIIDSFMRGAQMIQTIRLTTERGMKDFLDQLIDRFSIGWYFDGVECSICGDNWWSCDHYPSQLYDGETCELIFLHPTGKETSAVNAPAVEGTYVLEQLSQLKEPTMSKENQIALPDGTIKTVKAVASSLNSDDTTPTEDQKAMGNAAMMAEIHKIQADMLERQREELIASSNLSGPSRDVVRTATRGQDLEMTRTMLEAQARAEAAAADRFLVSGVAPINAGQMSTPEDRIQSALSWIFGNLGETTPPPSMRSIRDIYQAVTGDSEWHGKFDPTYSQLASANTTTMAGMVVDALNKAVMMHYDNMITYRWYENITYVVPHDGSTHDIELIMVDGIANLPTVGEGAAYTEANVGDSKESMSFAKKGHYVGITLETIRKSQIQRLQAIPRELVKAAVRTRSAAIAGIFTTASGVGPTLADDSTVLFHADHGNIDTGALDATEWAQARSRIWEQNIPGTSLPLGLWPTICLVPIELYDTALTLFGYGAGDVGKPNSAATAQEVNPYAAQRPGDPRPVAIPVPEWTDANDWAYMVDPRLHPVIHLSYANAPQGNSHPLPEIYEASGETTGLMFTNDTLPVKVRDWWAYGVGTYVGIGKNNVT